MSTSGIKENKLYYESKRWQRFVHFIYINDLTSNLFSDNCEETVYKALNYVHASRKKLVKTNITTTSVMNPLLQKSDYLEYFNSNIKKLKSLQDQNSKNIEDTLSKFDAPLLHIRLMLWTPIFQKWKNIFTNPLSDVYNIVYNSIQIILNQERKSVSTFALNLGLKNPSAEIYKKLANSLQCKHSENVRNLLKQIVLEENIIRPAYERGIGKFLFLTDKAIKQYSDNWDISFLSSSNVRLSLHATLKNTEHSQITADNEVIAKSEDSIATSLKNIRLSQSKKRKMSDPLLKNDEMDSTSHKRRKLHDSTESLTSIISETNENQEEDNFGEPYSIWRIPYRKEQNDINKSEIKRMYSEVKTAKTVINDLSEERKTLLVQIKELQNQKNQWNEDSKKLHLDLDSKIEEIKKLEEELQNEQTLRVYEELKLRSEIENVKKMNSELISRQGRMFVEINVLQKEIEKLERVKKEHQEKTEKFEETSHVCFIADHQKKPSIEPL